MLSRKFVDTTFEVIPGKLAIATRPGIQEIERKSLDSRLRGNDETRPRDVKEFLGHNTSPCCSLASNDQGTSPPERRQWAYDSGVQTVQIVQPLRFVQSPFFIFPRDAGEERDGGLNGLNSLSVLNLIS